jgi:predicted permease
MESAQAEMVSIQNALNQQYPENRPKSISVIPELSQVVGDMRPALLILFGAVGFVLLIACANVANLLLARATARQKEITIRCALGARRWAIVRQLLTESVLLSLAGAIPGVMLAVWGIAACTRLAPGKLPRVAESGVNLEVLGFTVLMAVVTGILFGLVPALHASRFDLNRSLNEGGRGGSDSTRRSRIRTALVVSEVGIAMVLLVGAGLLLQSLFRLRQVSPGFVADHVISFGLEPPDSRYSDEQRARFYRELLQRIGTIPGVKSAAAVFPLPMSGVSANTSFEVEGRPIPEGQRPATDVSLVSPGYFQTMGIPLLQGRVFTEHDDAQAPAVAIVNETFARRYFPGENLLGKHIRPGVWHAKGDGPMFEIVGVVGDVKHGNLSRPADPEVYQPDAQNSFAQLSVTVRTSLPPESIVSSLREQVQALDKSLPLVDVKTMEGYVSDAMAAPRFDTVLLGIFAGLALLLTAIGLYGVISYSVTQRMHEMGIRIALGAQSTDILRMIMRQGLLLAMVGVGIGLAASLGTARIIASLLYGIRATDIGTFVAIAAVLMGVALVASYVPARQATKVDPMVALRYE